MIQIDTLTDNTSEIIDTVKTTALNLIDNDRQIEVTSFDWEKTLFTAFIGALIAQGLVILISWIKVKIDLKTKKNLLITDLKNQKTVILKLKTAYETLLDKFNRQDTKTHSYETFEDLHTDIYESIPKTDLYKVFGKRISKLVEIYKTIRFLKSHSVDTIYRDYITKLDNHLKEKRDNPKHEYYCKTHLGYINIATGQLRSNIKTIEELLTDIDNFTN